jgi:hypothetical protein
VKFKNEEMRIIGFRAILIVMGIPGQLIETESFRIQSDNRLAEGNLVVNERMR